MRSVKRILVSCRRMAAAFLMRFVISINSEAGRAKRVRKGHPGVRLPGERLQTGLTGQYSGRNGRRMTGDSENRRKEPRIFAVVSLCPICGRFMGIACDIVCPKCGTYTLIGYRCLKNVPHHAPIFPTVWNKCGTLCVTYMGSYVKCAIL